jgi:hypothetical protein
VSTDEKSSIQALERLHPSLPMRAGQRSCARQEQEYKRHGTRCLFANFEVATGKIIAPSIGPTRTNEDFAYHIEKTIATDPEGEWVFVVDQLNIHQSEALVKLVAKECSIEMELDGKGNLKHIKAMASRRTFLQNPTHRIRFVYTPKHTSWLNQVELWFSILVRRLLKRGARELRLGGRFAPADRGIHRVLQPNDGQTVQVDLQGPSAQGLNRWVIYTAML